MNLRCTSPGYSGTRMWTQGRIYPATVYNPARSTLLSVRDNLGNERIIWAETLTFPMGAERDGTTYTATFEAAP